MVDDKCFVCGRKMPKCKWRDIISIRGGSPFVELYDCEYREDDGTLDLDKMFDELASEYCCERDDIMTAMMDNMDFDQKDVGGGIESLGAVCPFCGGVQ